MYGILLLPDIRAARVLNVKRPALHRPVLIMVELKRNSGSATRHGTVAPSTANICFYYFFSIKGLAQKNL